MRKRKKRFSVTKWIRSKGKRARGEEAVVDPGLESAESEADKTFSFFDRSDRSSHAYCDDPEVLEGEDFNVERRDARTQKTEAV